MNGQDRAHAVPHAFAEPGLEAALDAGSEADEALAAHPLGGIVARAIRSHQLWLTVGYFAVLLLLARAYA
jgi:hypothetical protein